MHIYAAKQTIAIPTDLNLTELLFSSATQQGLPKSHVVAVDTIQDRSLTIDELRNNAGRLAQGLNSKYSPRDQSRWAILLPNSVNYLEVVHAILWQGGVCCPVNFQLQALEIAYALSVTKAEFAIVYSKIVPKVLQAFELAKKEFPGFKAPQVIVALGEATGFPSLNDFLAAEKLPVKHHGDTRTRLASINLSSGTTGKPKGVGLSHYNYVSNVLQMVRHDPRHWNSETSLVSPTPMAHIAQTTCPLYLSPYTGTKFVLMHAFTGVDNYFELVAKHKATDIVLMPPLISVLLDSGKAKKYDVSSVRHIHNIGGMKQEPFDRIQSMQDWKFVNLFGMTEAAGYVAWSKVDQKCPDPPQVGWLLPNTQARLCDGDGKDVKIGESGEMWLKAPNMTNGYIDNPSANASAFKDGDWYNTGDVCTISTDGLITVVGRTKELFKSSGFQVSPTELEAYLVSHPDIAEVSVGPTYDKEKATDVATAYVVLKPTVSAKEAKLKSLESIYDFLEGKVSGYKKLRGGVFEVSGLAKNGTGKILRNQIADQKTGIVYLPSKPKAKL